MDHKIRPGERGSDFRLQLAQQSTREDYSSALYVTEKQVREYKHVRVLKMNSASLGGLN